MADSAVSYETQAEAYSTGEAIKVESNANSYTGKTLQQRIGEQGVRKRLHLGGLNPDTTDADLQNHFGVYGTLKDYCTVSFKRNQKKVGFVEYEELEAIGRVEASQPHILLGCEISLDVAKPPNDVKIAPNDQNIVYVTAITDAITEDDLKSHFGQFGNVTRVVILGQNRPYAFVHYENITDAQTVVKMDNHFVKGIRLKVEISRTLPRSDPRYPEGSRPPRRKRRFDDISYRPERGPSGPRPDRQMYHARRSQEYRDPYYYSQPPPSYYPPPPGYYPPYGAPPPPQHGYPPYPPRPASPAAAAGPYAGAYPQPPPQNRYGSQYSAGSSEPAAAPPRAPNGYGQTAPAAPAATSAYPAVNPYTSANTPTDSSQPAAAANGYYDRTGSGYNSFY